MAQTQLAGTIANSTNHRRTGRPLARNPRAAASHRRLAITTPAISSVATRPGSGQGECQGSQAPAAMMAMPTATRPTVMAPAKGAAAGCASWVAAEKSSRLDVPRATHAGILAWASTSRTITGRPAPADRVGPRISERAKRWVAPAITRARGHSVALTTWRVGGWARRRRGHGRWTTWELGTRVVAERCPCSEAVGCLIAIVVSSAT